MTERPSTAHGGPIPDTAIAPPRPPASSEGEDRGPVALLGLSTAEQTLYEELLTRPPVTAADVDDLAAELGWDDDETQAVLDRLCVLGLVTCLATTPPRHTVVSPYNALHARLDTHSHGLTRAHRRMLDLSTRFHTRRADRDAGVVDRTGHTAVADAEHGDGADSLITVVRGREAITQALEEANRGIRHEVLSFDSPPYFGDPNRGNIVRTGDQMAGVAYRAIYDPQALAAPVIVPTLLLTDRKAEHSYRVADVPVKLALIDGRLGLMPLDRHATPIEAFLVIGDTAVLAALRALFELCWQHAIPVLMRDDATASELPRADRELLVLLTAGHTDRVIAERFGSHERTVRRRVADLMRRIGAETRFQAGYRAVADGWLQPDFATAVVLAAATRNAAAGPTPDDGAKPDGTPERMGRP